MQTYQGKAIEDGAYEIGIGGTTFDNTLTAINTL